MLGSFFLLGFAEKLLDFHCSPSRSVTAWNSLYQMDYKNHFSVFPPQCSHRFLHVCVSHLLHKSICAKLHAFHTVAVFYPHVLCVLTHQHNCVYVFCIYLHSSGRDAKEFFALGFLSNSVAKTLLLSSLLLGFKSITEWGTSQGSTIFVF